MNISPEQQVNLIATVAKIDERTETILTRLDKHEASFQTQIDDITGRVGDLEKDRTKLWTLYAAALMLVGVIWGVGGDFVKQTVFGSPVEASSIHHNK